MFRVKYWDQVYTVYSVRYDKKHENTYFLIYKNGEWKWVDSCFYELVEEE